MVCTWSANAYQRAKGRAKEQAEPQLAALGSYMPFSEKHAMELNV